MSANAGTWFYRQPESQPFMVTERLNGTFWQARAVEVYWRCTEAGSTFKADGYFGETLLEMEWEPEHWLRLKAPAGFDLKQLTGIISRQILAIPAALSFSDSAGNQFVEWHRDGGDARWTEIQGTGGYVMPRRLNQKKGG